MLAILLYGFLGIGAVLAMGAMIGTWRQYAAAWDAMAAERSSSHRFAVRYVTVRVVSDRNWVPVPVAEFKTKPPVERLRPGLRAAA